jgi:hypothetical protein
VVERRKKLKEEVGEVRKRIRRVEIVITMKEEKLR